MAEQDLLRINTNSANDSKGFAFGLGGNLFLFIVGGGIASILLALLFTALFRLDLLAASVLAVAPMVTSTLYAIVFLNNRPPHYKDDLFHAMIGEDCVEIARNQRMKPFSDESRGPNAVNDECSAGEPYGPPPESPICSCSP